MDCFVKLYESHPPKLFNQCNRIVSNLEHAATISIVMVLTSVTKLFASVIVCVPIVLTRI